MLQPTARKRLQQARWRAGLSRQALSEATQGRVSTTTIFKVEDEKGNPDYTPLPQTIYILAEALELDADKELFSAEAAS